MANQEFEHSKFLFPAGHHSLNILRVCYEYPPPWDGLAPGPFEMSLAQAKQGHAVFYLAGGNKNAPHVHQAGIEVKRTGKSLPNYLFGPFFSFDIAVLFSLRKAIKKNDIDVIHFHGNTALWFNVFRLWGWHKNIPYVYHVHSSGIKYFHNFWKKAKLLTKIKTLFIWPFQVFQDFLTVKTADTIIAVSERDRDVYINSYNCPKDKISVVENGVNTEKFRLKDTEKKTTSLNLLYVGKLIERKNVEKIFYTVKALVDKGFSPALSIVGRGETQYISRLKSLAIELNIQDIITWLGYVPYPDLPAVYDKHDVLLLLSHSEGLPKVILEAFSCGLKVVSTKSFSVSGYLNTIIEWVDLDADPDKIAEKILMVLDKNIDFEHFRTTYSWERKTEDVNRIYDKLSLRGTR